MHKIVSHPYFSSELDNLFPTLSLLVLHFLIISSSLGCKTWFSVHSVVQTINSTHILSWLHGIWEERIFSPLCCSHPCNSLASFHHASSWPWSCLHLPHNSAPKAESSLPRSTTLEGSLHGIFDANSTWLFTASNTSFWSVGLQLVQKVQVGFGFQKSGIWIPFHKDVHSFLGFIKTCVSWVLSPFGCCFPHLIVNIDLESEKQMPLTS